MREIGLVYGPDAIGAFLAANRVRLLIRSHEGPDARDKRLATMGSVTDGWCVDAELPSGRLATLFSAPDYPQFLPDGAARVSNRGAVAVLSPPEYDQVEVRRFDAAPRPASSPFYDVNEAGSDEEGPN